MVSAAIVQLAQLDAYMTSPTLSTPSDGADARPILSDAHATAPGKLFPFAAHCVAYIQYRYA